MIFIKYILMFFIFLNSILLGILYSKKYENRLKELEKINTILNIFEAKVKFTCLSIKEIFEEVCNENKDNIGKLFGLAKEYMEEETSKVAWEKAIENKKEEMNLNKEDIEVLKTLGKMLGNTDVEGQVSQIELTKSLINTQIENAKIEKNKNSKLYKTLGASIGLVIVIILI